MNNKVEYNGKLYELGKYYVFSLPRGDQQAGLYSLSGINKGSEFPFIANSGYGFGLCSTADNVPVGTIEDAPFKPEVGKLYQFSDDGERWVIAELETALGSVYVEQKCLRGVFRVRLSESNLFYCRPVLSDQRAEYGD
jgi:hypothetical protein